MKVVLGEEGERKQRRRNRLEEYMWKGEDSRTENITLGHGKGQGSTRLTRWRLQDNSVRKVKGSRGEGIGYRNICDKVKTRGQKNTTLGHGKRLWQYRVDTLKATRWQENARDTMIWDRKQRENDQRQKKALTRYNDAKVKVAAQDGRRMGSKRTGTRSAG